MNGQWLGNRSIRTNWATRKPPPPRGNEQGGSGGSGKHLNFDDVYNQSSVTNCTVYCGGLSNGISEDIMQRTFSPFGQLFEIRVFKDKGFAFIRFNNKEAATNAIVAVHNTEINGQSVKCSWGKESGESSGPGQNQNSGQQYGSGGGGGGSNVPNYAAAAYGQQMLPQWYGSGYPAAAAAQQMQNQFMQGVQGYAAYGNGGGYGQQGGYMAAGLQGLQASGWGQGMPGSNAGGQHQAGGQSGGADAATAAAYAMMQAQFQAQ
jgi:nucleolysin TIA-1/TIAR